MLHDNSHCLKSKDSRQIAKNVLDDTFTTFSDFVTNEIRKSYKNNQQNIVTDLKRNNRGCHVVPIFCTKNDGNCLGSFTSLPPAQYNTDRHNCCRNCSWIPACDRTAHSQKRFFVRKCKKLYNLIARRLLQTFHSSYSVPYITRRPPASEKV